jgi:heptaprenyl diphosphate synthase
MDTVTAQRFSGPRAVVESVGAELAASLRTDLDLVEGRLRETLRDPEAQFMSTAATHLIDAGGKRFRPMMVLLGAQFGEQCDEVLDAAVVSELVHVATLYHDDVMDEAPIRHGVVTANARWSNTTAVLLGDYLLAKAAELGAGLGTDALRLQVQTLRRLVRGQIEETVGVRPGVDRAGHCLRVMSDKSASLISMAVRMGAMVSGADRLVSSSLEKYGELLGVAFQISDDVLDISATAQELGKQPGTDLREGIVTLPVVFAVEHEPNLAELLMSGPIADDVARAEALAVLRTSPGLDHARAEAVRHAERAKEMLYDVPDIPARAALAALCDFVTSRTA